MAGVLPPTTRPSRNKIWIGPLPPTRPIAAARRWLALLSGKLQPKDLQPSEHAAGASACGHPETGATVRTFTCPQCGGSLRFDPESTHLKCQQCGALEVVVEVAPAGGEQILDYALPTRAGHAWAEAQRRQTCQQCGAATIFPAGLTSTQCPFCGATAFIAAPEDATLVRPSARCPCASRRPAPRLC